MITKLEIEAKAAEFEINVSNVERDYVFGWLLCGIFTVSSLKDYIFLKGGNALRKGYFENTRFSSDLDFGIPNDIAQEDLLSEINRVCDFIEEKAGVIFVKENNLFKEKFSASETPLPDLKVYEGRIYFKDFYGNADYITLKISLDITRFDRVLLPLQEVSLIHPYSDSAEIQCVIRCMKLEEIIATKLKCLLQRQHAPDLFDYVHSIKLLGGTIDKDEIVQTFIQKTIFSRNPYLLKAILAKTPFDYFKKYWVKGIVCAKSIAFNVEEAINFFVDDIESLFSSFSDNGYVQFVYFSPELRMPILQAGREQTLLRVTYNGSVRMIEPYSLKYLQKRNGEAREYLYVYNCSGGGSDPGIRCFIPSGFSSIENTDEKFEPRNTIELSKAGEYAEKKYLFDPNKPALSNRRQSGGFGRVVKRQTIKYVYQCTFCGKQVSKTHRDSSIGEHMNKNGFRCSGRRGFYVTTKYP